MPSAKHRHPEQWTSVGSRPQRVWDFHKTGDPEPTTTRGARQFGSSVIPVFSPDLDIRVLLPGVSHEVIKTFLPKDVRGKWLKCARCGNVSKHAGVRDADGLCINERHCVERAKRAGLDIGFRLPLDALPIGSEVNVVAPFLTTRDTAEAFGGFQKARILSTLFDNRDRDWEYEDLKVALNLLPHDLTHALHDLKTRGLVTFREGRAQGKEGGSAQSGIPLNIRLTKYGVSRITEYRRAKAESEAQPTQTQTVTTETPMPTPTPVIERRPYTIANYRDVIAKIIDRLGVGIPTYTSGEKLAAELDFSTMVVFTARAAMLSVHGLVIELANASGGGQRSVWTVTMPARDIIAKLPLSIEGRFPRGWKPNVPALAEPTAAPATEPAPEPIVEPSKPNKLVMGSFPLITTLLTSETNIREAANHLRRAGQNELADLALGTLSERTPLELEVIAFFGQKP